MIRLPVISAAPGTIPVNANCGRCSAICCNYISTEIDVPTTKKDFDTIRWYLIHPGVRVYCEDSSGSWFVQFMSRCRHLREDNLCGIYDTRPQICRDLDPMLCEFAMGPGDRWLFKNAEEFERWMQERERQRLVRRARRTAQPTSRRHEAGHTAKKPAAVRGKATKARTRNRTTPSAGSIARAKTTASNGKRRDRS